MRALRRSKRSNLGNKTVQERAAPCGSSTPPRSTTWQRPPRSVPSSRRSTWHWLTPPLITHQDLPPLAAWLVEAGRLAESPVSHDQVRVFGRERIARAAHVEAGPSLGRPSDACEAIAGHEEQILAIVAPWHQVARLASHDSASGSGHGPTRSLRHPAVKPLIAQCPHLSRMLDSPAPNDHRHQ